MRASPSRRSLGSAAPRVDSLDEARLADRNMDEAGRRIEESHVRGAGNRPDVLDLTGDAVDFDQRAVVAGGIEATATVIDIETMCASRRHLPLPHHLTIADHGD